MSSQVSSLRRLESWRDWAWRAAVHAAEAISTGTVKALAEIAEHHDDFYMIDQIRFEGTLSGALADSEVAFQVDYTFMNNEKRQGFDLAVSEFDLDGMVKRLVDNIRDGLEA